ncbi:MAG: hypothetical protein WCI45_06410, partial [Desulfuromonadales bacterium]
LVLFFSGGGLFVTFYEDSVQSATSDIAVLSTIITAAFLGVFFCCRSLLRCKPDDSNTDCTSRCNRLIFSLIFFIVLVTSTLVLMNLAASFYTVSWPMSGLHGVSSDVGEKAWLYHEKSEHFVKVNSWGQRDLERTLQPKPGTYRTIFIGDSFLENGAAVPLPFRTEEILKSMGRQSQEIINLGVSATDPDEYFFRLKKIGMHLQPSHCVMLFYAGNDFIQEPSLLSYGGISATYPRWSFLQILGLHSLDQIISNERRPVLRAWFKGGSLLKHELKLKDIFAKTIDDQDTEITYLSFFPLGEQAQLKSILHKSSAVDRSRFYSMLRHPDEGQFRSYYLDIATKVAKGLPSPDFVSSEYSFRWVKAASEYCRSKGVMFTLVVIPEGFTVDSRMSEQYSAIADMKTYMKHKDEAVGQLVSQAVETGIDVVDLSVLLRGVPGAYLNMDGHWSQQGVDAVAELLAKKISAYSLNDRTNKLQRH